MFSPDCGPMQATLPGSAHTTLRSQKVIPDWNYGLNTRSCEWVEHRHWEFFTEFARGEIEQDQSLQLEADGLDYSGWIVVDTQIIAEFSGALIRHRFDLTPWLGDGEAHRLSLIFDTPPEEQGQVGFTSRSHYFKPRYNFSWDWCPRLAPVGVWDELRLVCGSAPIEVLRLDSRLIEGVGMLRFLVNAQSEECRCLITVEQEPGHQPVIVRDATLPRGESMIELIVPDVQLWWPHGMGAQSLYRVHVSTGESTVFDARTGFKSVNWRRHSRAPEGTLPLLCEINGAPIFMQGVNWTPIRLDYHAIDVEQYRELIELYRSLGCNVLRVWGGGFLERECFYRLCDEYGLLVWQEFPLSSSGIENYAPEDPIVIETLRGIARDYIRRRGHHACKLVWCGGNELQTKPTEVWGYQVPLDATHPALKALQEIVAEEDPQALFIPTSPSGPSFYANEENFGRSLHHHVHGPWNHEGDLAGWEQYWNQDDSHLRSEVGFPGAMSAAAIERYSEDDAWPPTLESDFWRHSSAWWLQWEDFQREVPEGNSLADYVAWSQERQARALATAARACKRRFPEHAGFILWMGHDAFPCPSNTAIIDFDGNPKPAYHALKSVFQSD